MTPIALATGAQTKTSAGAVTPTTGLDAGIEGSADKRRKFFNFG